jgi:arylsulfatase A-like enzyme
LQGVRAALAPALAVGLALQTIALIIGGSCSGNGEPVRRSGPDKPSTTVAARTGTQAPGRAARRQRPRPPASQIVTRPLLDEKWVLTVPPAKRIGRLYNLLRARHWRLSGYRHSRLPPEQRLLEGLVTFRYDKPKHWVAQHGKLLSPRRRASKGKAFWRLGKPKKWPWSPGVYETNRSLLLFAGMAAQVKVRVPSRAVLTFDLGLVPGRMGRRPLELTLQLIGPGGGSKELLDHHLGRVQAGRWFPVRFDLSAYAGQIVTLRFAVRKQGPETQHIGAVAVGRPALQGEVPGSVPNLIVVVLDTVRHDALSCYVGRRTHTPHVDGVARRGALFVNAFTNAAWTRPSLMSLFSSRYPHVAGSTPKGFRASRVDRWYLQHGRVPTLFAHLAGQGYLTRGLLNNFFMLPHERVGHDHGLGSFAHILFGQGPRRRDNPTITAGVERFLAAHKRHRFFLYVLYESAHAPYTPPQSARRRMRALIGLDKRKGRRRTGRHRRLHMMERYRAEVINLDDHVGRILAALKKHGLSDNTYVVITSDHGEVISRQHCFFIPRLNYRSCYSHSASLYDQVLRIPMVLQGPAVSPGRRLEQTYQHVDLVPTLLDLMGLPGLPGAVGHSHAKRLRSAKALPVTPRDIYALGRWVTALRSGRYKLILRAHQAQGIVKSGKRRHVPAELYDLEKDPDERWNLARHLPDVVARLRARLKRYVQQDRVPELPGMPRAILRDLRARQGLLLPRRARRRRRRRRARRRRLRQRHR